MSETVRDPREAALSELRAAGLIVDRLELGSPPRGKVWRVPVEGRAQSKRPGWYYATEVTRDDGSVIVVGAYGIWQGAETTKETFKLRGVKLTDGERDRARAKQKSVEQQRADHEFELLRETAEKATTIWRGLRNCSTTPYLQKKGVVAYGLGLGRDGVCVVPLRDTAGAIRQLQFIDAAGDKRFLTGPGKLGSYHLIGSVVAEHPLIFAEGYATGASIHEATGWPVVVCIDAANILAVADRLRPIWPDTDFVFAIDDDREKKKNTGREVVAKAATKHHAKIAVPRFKEPLGKSDWNDLHAEQGLAAVREQLQAVFTPLAPADARPRTAENWWKDLIRNDRGVVCSLHNLITILENEACWKGVLGYNQFSKRVEFRKPPPWGKETGPLRDSDEIAAAAWFGRPDTWQLNVKTLLVREALVRVADLHPWHPIRDYYQSLVWDGEDRIDYLFSDYCGVPRTPTITGFARNFFIQAVARVFRPGCKGRLMLVLEGPQGKMKSTLVEALAGPAFYADIGTPPSVKDFFQDIQGKQIIELSELASFARAEAAHIKRAVSLWKDTFRPSYGRNSQDFPRECVFVGTVNNSDWQRDETGGTRFMPIWIEQEIDIAGVLAIRDQLWAEAVHRFNEGEAWWVLPDGAEEAQEARYLDDIWTERVIEYVEQRGRHASPMNTPLKKVTVAQLLSFAIDMDPKKQDRPAQTRMGALMTRLGWVSKQKRVSGNARIREYHRPETAT